MYELNSLPLFSRIQRIFTVVLILTFSLPALGQKSSSHSPYSQFGLGQMRQDHLPQNRAMGGISTGVRYINGLPFLNVSNPASYSAFNRTILEAGLYGNITQLSKNSISDHTADFAFGHLAFGIPLQSAGGFAFGIMPYSDVGYSNSSLRNLDTIQYRSKVSGEGGLNKAFVGYGISPIKGLSIGANVGLLFGELSDISSMEFPLELSAYQTKQQETRNIKGALVDYGIQYFTPIGKNKHFTIGYSGSLNNTVRSRTTILRTTHEPYNDPEMTSIIRDTTFFETKPERDINLPLKHNVGISIGKGYNWMVGADFNYADWSDFQTRAKENKLNKNYGIAVGGQIRPDPTSIRYFNQVEYRLGFRYNKTQLQLNQQDIKDMAITAGFGFPLPEKNFGNSFSTIHISAEFGQMGTLSNNLVRERYININVGFTINDTWFRRYADQ